METKEFNVSGTKILVDVVNNEYEFKWRLRVKFAGGMTTGEWVENGAGIPIVEDEGKTYGILSAYYYSPIRISIAIETPFLMTPGMLTYLRKDVTDKKKL